MAARDLITSTQATAFAPPTASVDATQLATCITAASMAFEGMCGRRISKATYTAALHSGDRSNHGQLYLADPATGLRTGDILQVTALTEDGTSLAAGTVVSGWGTGVSSSTKVIVDRYTGVASRIYYSSGSVYGTAWAAGVANISFSYTAGYMPDPGGTPGTYDLAMPSDITQAVCELTWLLYREGFRSGIQSLSGVGASSQFTRDLSPFANTTIQAWVFDTYIRTLGP